MDEIFHVPQAQKYCHGKFSEVRQLRESGNKSGPVIIQQIKISNQPFNLCLSSCLIPLMRLALV